MYAIAIYVLYWAVDSSAMLNAQIIDQVVFNNWHTGYYITMPHTQCLSGVCRPAHLCMHVYIFIYVAFHLFHS